MTMPSASDSVYDPTVDCYNRRRRILTNAHRAEWWMAVAVLLLIASIGFVIL